MQWGIRFYANRRVKFLINANIVFVHSGIRLKQTFLFVNVFQKIYTGQACKIVIITL